MTPELAAEIADETTRILGHNVLITDENAEVIGSGDVSRVGTIHEASVAVVKSGVAASHNAEEAAALVGVRPGITMPIVLDGAVIGTVGITGSPAQVVRLGRLVQRQTEILLRESMFQRTRLLRENRLTQLVRDIVEFDPRILDEQIIRATGVELGYDLGQQRVAVLFEVQHGPDSYPSSVRAIGEVFDARTDIVAELAAGRYVVLHHPSADDAEHLRSCVRRAAALLRERHGVVVHIGIGESGSGSRRFGGFLRRCEGRAAARREQRRRRDPERFRTSGYASYSSRRAPRRGHASRGRNSTCCLGRMTSPH